MKELDGFLVYESLSELADPSHSALLIIDVQNDFCTRGGAFSAHGYDVGKYTEMVSRLGTLLNAAREAGVQRVFLQNTVLPGQLSDSPSWVRFKMRLSRNPDEEAIRYTVAGSWGHRFVQGIEPRNDEIVVQKFRSSGFTGTSLDMLLRANGIETIIVTGATTEGCVESSARDGMFLDYYVVVVADCVQSDTPQLHEASMTLMKNRFDVVDSEELIASWIGHPSSPGRS